MIPEGTARALWIVLASVVPLRSAATQEGALPSEEVRALTERVQAGVRLVERLASGPVGSRAERERWRDEILDSADAATALIDRGEGSTEACHASRLYLLRSLFSRTLPVDLPSGERARSSLEWLRESAQVSSDAEAKSRALLTCARRLREAGYVDEAWETLELSLGADASVELLIEGFGLAVRAFDWEALERLDEWLTRRFEEAGDSIPIQLAWMLADERMRLSLRLGRLDEAQNQLDELLRLARREDLPADFRVATRLAEIDCLLGLGDSDSAWIEVSRPLPADLPSSLRELLQGHFAARRGLIAADLYLRGLVTFDEARAALAAVGTDDSAARFVAQSTLAHLFEVSGRHREAREVLDRLPASRLEDLEFDARARHETLTTWITLAHADGLAREELDRVVARAERLFEEQCEHWARVPVEEGAIGFLQFEHRRSVLSVCIQAWIAAHGKEVGVRRGFEAWLRARALGSLARRTGLSPPSLEDVRRALTGPDTGLIAYLPSDFGVQAFVVGEDSLEHFVLESGVGLKRAVADFRSAIAETLASGASGASDPAGSSAAESADRLRRAAERVALYVLSPELRERLRSKRHWILAGVDMLDGLPFEALPGTHEDWLGHELALSYVPAIPFALWNAERPTAEPNGELVVFAEGRSRPDRTPPLPALDLDTETIEDWLARAGIEGARVYADGRATRSVLGSPAVRAAAWQFFAHGRYDPQAGGPAILLAPGGDAGTDGPADGSLSRPSFVEARGERSIRPAELVVLGTCASMRGPQRVGDDAPDHLGTDFLAAGAKTVLLSSYELDYAATLELCAQFWRALRSDASCRPSEALRRARVAVARTPRFRGPAFWATLQAYGSDRRPNGLRVAPGATELEGGEATRRFAPLVIVLGASMLVVVLARRALGLRGPTGRTPTAAGRRAERTGGTRR